MRDDDEWEKSNVYYANERIFTQILCTHAESITQRRCFWNCLKEGATQRQKNESGASGNAMRMDDTAPTVTTTMTSWNGSSAATQSETKQRKKKNQNATEYEKIMLKHLLRNVIIPERVCLCACWPKFCVPRFGIIHVACGTENWQPEESGTTNKMMKFDVIQLGYTMPFRAVSCLAVPWSRIRCAM